MKYITSVSFNMNRLIKALDIDEDHVLRFICDGRNASFLMKFRLAEEFNFELAEGYNAPAHLLDFYGKRWIIKTCTPVSGVSFCANSMIGSGRKYDANKFFDSLKENIGFLVCDLGVFPDVDVYEATPKEIVKLAEKGVLKNGRLSYSNFEALLEEQKTPQL